jgi:hypothetical protein
LPGSLATNPVLGRWLDFGRHSEVTVRVGKVEYGQGIWTALAQVAAEELQVDLAQVRMAPVSTSTSPDEGVTSGSRSVQDSGSALRQACAQARELLLAAAADRLAGHPAALSVTDGQILASGRPTGLSYWSLATPGTLDRSAGDPVPTRPPGGWIVAGRAAARLDLPDKVTGRPRFIHDLVLPGMLFGRVVRPPSVAAELSELPAVRLGSDDLLVQDGSFVGVVAETDRAALRRRGGWRARPCGSWRTLPVRCRTARPAGLPAGGAIGTSASAQAAGFQRRRHGQPHADGEFTRPFIAHASIAPAARSLAGTATPSPCGATAGGFSPCAGRSRSASGWRPGR